MAQNLTYTQCGDYFIPDIRLAHTEAQILGKYGRMRRIFLEQNKPILFNDMILNETLFLHLWEVQQTCVKRMELLMEELLANNPAPDKATQQLVWVAHMNSLKAQAEESVLRELVYEEDIVWKILEEFWYGNIEPTDYDTSSCKEYKKLQELICRNEEKLRVAMTDEQKTLFEKYTDCVREHQTITECLIFQNSFKLGARMMLEVMEE